MGAFCRNDLKNCFAEAQTQCRVRRAARVFPHEGVGGWRLRRQSRIRGTQRKRKVLIFAESTSSLHCGLCDRGGRLCLLRVLSPSVCVPCKRHGLCIRRTTFSGYALRRVQSQFALSKDCFIVFVGAAIGPGDNHGRMKSRPAKTSAGLSQSRARVRMAFCAEPKPCTRMGSARRHATCHVRVIYSIFEQQTCLYMTICK